MKTIKATVVIPTYNHAQLLTYSVATACQQTIEDIEIFIVGDSVSSATLKIVEDLKKQDHRIHFFDNKEKDPNKGEIHRNKAIIQAQGEIVCYLSDDDLWLPNHIETMYELLKEAEFANSIPVIVHPYGVYQISPVDLAQPYFRQSMFMKQNRIPLTFAAHTLAAYKQLSQGWQTTPLSLQQIKREIFQSCWHLLTWYEACYETKIENLQAEIIQDKQVRIQMEEEHIKLLKEFQELHDKVEEVGKEKDQLQAHLKLTLNSLTWKIRKNFLAIPLLPRVIRLSLMPFLSSLAKVKITP